MPHPEDSFEYMERMLTRVRGQLAALECCMNGARKLMYPTLELAAIDGLIETMDHETANMAARLAALPHGDDLPTHPEGETMEKRYA